jgi:hypothetical protein
MHVLVGIAFVLILFSPLVAAAILYLLRRRLGPAMDAYGEAQVENERRRSRGVGCGVGWLLDAWRARWSARQGY